MGVDKTTAKPQLDWERIERDYRSGQMSILEMARIHNCTRAAIQRKAKAHGWTRNLDESVKTRIEAGLIAPSGCDEELAIQEAAARGIEVVRQHRRLLSRTFALAERILVQTENDPTIPVNDLCNAFRTLSQGIEKAINCERQTYNLDGKGHDPASRTEEISELDSAARVASLLALAVRRKTIVEADFMK